MLNTLRAFLLICASTAHADVDGQFSKGVLGVAWTASLEDVRAKFPGGTAWPNGGETGLGEVVYAVAGDFKVLDVEVTVPLVHFIFSKENNLVRVFFHFRLADRDAALYGIAQILGQDYTVRDAAMARIFEWKPGRLAVAKFEIGSGPAFPWAFFGVGPLKAKYAGGR
jgi:hypothetical protein